MFFLLDRAVGKRNGEAQCRTPQVRAHPSHCSCRMQLQGRGTAMGAVASSATEVPHLGVPWGTSMSLNLPGTCCCPDWSQLCLARGLWCCRCRTAAVVPSPGTQHWVELLVSSPAPVCRDPMGETRFLWKNSLDTSPIDMKRVKQPEHFPEPHASNYLCRGSLKLGKSVSAVALGLKNRGQVMHF